MCTNTTTVYFEIYTNTVYVTAWISTPYVCYPTTECPQYCHMIELLLTLTCISPAFISDKLYLQVLWRLAFLTNQEAFTTFLNALFWTLWSKRLLLWLLQRLISQIHMVVMICNGNCSSRLTGRSILSTNTFFCT